MDRGRVPGAQGRPGRRQRRAAGIAVIERDGVWHLAGTFRAGGRSIRIRESTGLRCDADPGGRLAEEVRIRRERDLFDQVVRGKPAGRPFPAVTLDYLIAVNPGAGDIRNAKLWEIEFRGQMVTDLTPELIAQAVRRRWPKASPATTVRYLATLSAILKYAVRMGWLDRVPHIERPEAPIERRVNKMLPPDLVLLLAAQASPHLRPLIAFLACTGARMGEALALQVEDLILADGRARVFLRRRKTGADDGLALHGWAAEELRQMLLRRPAGQRQAGPVFLTGDLKPYRDTRGKHGGQIKTGFNAARRRAVAVLITQGRGADAALLAKVTPHWLRHNFASQVMAATGDGILVRDALGWASGRMVDRYVHLAPGRLDRAALALPFGTNMTRDDPVERIKSKSVKASD